MAESTLRDRTRQLEELTDEQVVARVRDGERGLFELLVRRYNQRLFRAVRAILRADPDAEEVLQEAWVRAFQHLGQFRGEARFSTWVTKIAIHEALAHRRRRSRLVLVGSVEHDLEAAPMMRSPLPDPEAGAENAELRRVLQVAIDALPQTLRTAYILRDVEGLDTRETASALGVVEGTVKVRLHRARRELRHSLERRFDAAARQLYPFLGERCDRLTAAVMARVLDPKEECR